MTPIRPASMHVRRGRADEQRGFGLRILAESTASLEKKQSFPTEAKGRFASAGFLPYKTAIVSQFIPLPPFPPLSPLQRRTHPRSRQLSISKYQRHEGCLH